MDSSFFILMEKVKDFKDVVFFLGAEQPMLPWNVPIPIFSNSPSFQHGEVRLYTLDPSEVIVFILLPVSLPLVPIVIDGGASA